MMENLLARKVGSKGNRVARRYLTRAAVVAALMSAAGAQAQSEVELLEQEVEQLKKRLDALEVQPSRQGSQSSAAESETDTGSVPRAEEAMDDRDPGDLSQAVPGTERSDESTAPDEPEPSVQIGGALRFNVIHRDYVEASDTKYGESGLDIFRLNVDGEVNNILISAEYRFYSYMHTIHHGWIGYEFEDTSQLQFGIHQVPFGLLPYAAHNAWFGVPYYVGLGDDYDMGIKYVRRDGPWTTHLAFYKNEELNAPTDLGRYSFDLVRVDEHQNEEINTSNARLSYTFGMETDCEAELGASAQLGQVYNATTDSRGDRWAAAAHLDARCGRWNLQLQGARYEFDAPHTAAHPRSSGTVRVGAFEASYNIPDESDIVVANLAYSMDPPWRQVEQVICYNDYSRLLNNHAGQDSQINTLGCAVGSGPLFTYVDFIMAKNMPFFGAGAMAGESDDEWHSRFNLNVGFYW